MSDRHIIAVFGSSTITRNDALYNTGISYGAALARAGLTVATGGYGGVMEAVSRGASEAGGHVIGVTAPSVFLHRHNANKWVTEEQPAETLPLRVAHLIEISDAAIALPGSIGTLTELIVAWNTSYVTRFTRNTPYPLLAVGPVWHDLAHYLAELLHIDGSLIHYTANVDEAITELTHRLGIPRGK